MEAVIERPTTTEPIYNGFSIRYILANLPKNISKYDRNEYLDNCLFVYVCEQSRTNLGCSELARDYNHRMIKRYIEVNNTIKH